MLEIEVKYRVSEFELVRRRLEELGAAPQPARREADHYFNAPDRDFGRTDEALRLRRIGPANRVTYKGPKIDRQTKTRTEIEVLLAEGEQAANDFCRLLTALGYRPTVVLGKDRVAYELKRDNYHLEVTLDTVDEVGLFVEIEILAPEAELATARQVLLRLADELGLTASERRSYLEMLLEMRGAST
jgi:adenylate cyclase class 2